MLLFLWYEEWCYGVMFMFKIVFMIYNIVF